MAGLHVTNLDHVTVVITDLERSRRFYRDVLGLQEVPPPYTFDFVVLWFAAKRGAFRRPGLITGGFGVVYGLARIFCEFFRDPDPKLERLGDALTMGIGAMTDARVKDFFDKMVKVGIVKADTDYKKSFTTKFINKGVGVELRPK